MNGNGNRRIGKDTSVTIGLVALLVIVAMSFQQLRSDVQYLRKEVSNLRNEFRARTGDRFTRYDMSSWVDQLEAKNPDLNVPEVKHYGMSRP